MKKIYKKILIILSTFIIISVFSYYIERSLYYAPTDEIKLPASIEEKLTTKIEAEDNNNINYAPRLYIPILKINAAIQNVGITKNGNMSTPDNYVDVGLYKYGTLPGDEGSAVIAGHVNNKFGMKAVFGNLNKIKEGNDIYVEMTKGVKLHFIVTSISIYDFNAPTEETGIIFTQNDAAYLKLITCTGKWMPSIRTHDKRLVVTAVKSDM